MRVMFYTGATNWASSKWAVLEFLGPKVQPASEGNIFFLTRSMPVRWELKRISTQYMKHMEICVNFNMF